LTEKYFCFTLENGVSFLIGEQLKMFPFLQVKSSAVSGAGDGLFACIPTEPQHSFGFLQWEKDQTKELGGQRSRVIFY